MTGRPPHVGLPLSRLDGPMKVRGAASFAAEVALPGLAYAALVFSTVARGRIATLDTGDAEAAPGVVLVMTHRNAPRMQPPPLFYTSPKAAAGDTVPVMQDDRIHWNGQPVALVLAATQEQADHAASLICASYLAEPAATSLASARTRGTEQATAQGKPLHIAIGDAPAALAAAPVAIDATYTTPFHTHNAMELHAATVAWDGDELIVHDATQWVTATAWSLAQVFGIDEAKVRVTSLYVGGGFGAKILWQHQVLAAAAAKLSGRPVRLVLSREGVYRVVGGRTLTEQRVAIGAQRDGRFDAVIHTGTTAMTRHNGHAEPVVHQTMTSYAAGSFLLDQRVAYMDMVGNTFMRAPGRAVGSFALESAVDELAVALGIDPIALRLRNEPERDPIAGTPFSSRHLVEAWRMGAERFDWARRHATPGAVRDGEWLVGMGCAAATYPYNRVPGAAARITLSSDGHALIEVAAHEMGMGTATAQTQVCADLLGLDIDKVRFAYGDSRQPGSVIAGGSQQTAAIIAAVTAAHRVLVADLIAVAGNRSPLAGLRTDEVETLDGGLAKRGDPHRYESYADILTRSRRDRLVAEADAPPPDEIKRWSMHSYGAMFCEVRVSTVTGETRVSRFLGALDCGRILNPKTAASQFRGGIIMGLGLALTEETLVDERSGRIMNPSLAEYHVPVHLDVPTIDIVWTGIRDPHAPLGARGVGEIGITGVGAAVANAVYNATGTRIRDLPITLDKLL